MALSRGTQQTAGGRGERHAERRTALRSRPRRDLARSPGTAPMVRPSGDQTTTVGDLVRRFVVSGANLLVDVTNDGWFLHSSGSRQHVANAVFRCVENRRPMVRAANTGVTCFVNEFGRVTQILQDDTGNTFNEGVLTGEINVPQDRYLTFYAQHGELFAELCAAVTAVAILAIFVLRRKL